MVSWLCIQRFKHLLGVLPVGSDLILKYSVTMLDSTTIASVFPRCTCTKLDRSIFRTPNNRYYACSKNSNAWASIKAALIIMHSTSMEFGSEFVYAQEGDEPELEYVEESRYNHTATGYSSVSADYKDDGEVSKNTVCI